MLKLELDKQVSAKLLKIMKDAPKESKKAFTIGMRRVGDELRNRASAAAPYKTGNLKRSITISEASSTHVTVGTNLVYARIHDLGGDIEPKKGKYLRFKIGGRWVSVKHVRINPYKGKGYLTPAFDEMVHGKAAEILTEEIQKVIS